MKRRLFTIFTAVVLLLPLSTVVNAQDEYTQRFIDLYEKLNDPNNGYFSADGVPYQWITGTYSDGLTTKAVAGAAIQVQLISDNSVRAWGYNIDDVQTADPDAPDIELYRPDASAESNHPYENNFDHTWTITNSDVNALSSKIHFSRIDFCNDDFRCFSNAFTFSIQSPYSPDCFFPYRIRSELWYTTDPDACK